MQRIIHVAFPHVHLELLSWEEMLAFPRNLRRELKMNLKRHHVAKDEQMRYRMINDVRPLSGVS